MKRKLFTVAIVLSFVSLTFMSCEEVKDITDVPIETTLSVGVSATSANGNATENSLKSTSVNVDVYPFEGSAVIDPTDDADIDKYWKKIRSWEIKKIHNSVSTITQAATLIKGKLTVKDNETNAELFTKEVEDVSLSNGADVMSIVGEDYTQIISALEDQHSLLVEFKGDLNTPGVIMVFTLGFDVKVIANPLN